jgi:hypothetical protein
VIRYSEQEYEHVKKQADKTGLTVASFLREISLENEPRRRGILDRDAERDIWKQVAGLGRNFNQITKRVNMSGVESISNEEMGQLAEAIHRITDAILELSGKK